MPKRREPAYQRVVDDLQRQIESGVLTEGDQLPGTRELAEQYDLPTGTIARAIEQLRSAGLVTTRQGSGIFVRRFELIRRSSPARLAANQWGSGAAIQDADTGKRPRTVDVETGEATPPEWARVALGLPADEMAAFRSRRFVVEDRYVQLATSWLPIDIARGTRIMHTDTGPGGTYARLAELGHTPARFTEELRARMPTAEETDRLVLPPGTPVLQVVRLAFNEAGRCVEVNRMILDGAAYVLDYSFHA